MSRFYQVPHRTIGWLLLAAIWSVLPALLDGSYALLVTVLLLFAWRWQVARARLAMPGRLLRTLLLVIVVSLVLWQYHTLVGPTAGVALLTAAFALKLLEMFRLRDAYVVVLLGYFVLATIFLFHRGLFMSLYVAVGFVLFTAVLIGINQADDKSNTKRHLRLALVMCLQAIPLMLVIFVLVPRVAPLWGIPQDQAKTGLPSSMAPGEISDVAQSADPVFRVTFDGKVPPRTARYWRSIIYSRFDGTRWHRVDESSIWHQHQVQYANQPEADWFQQLVARRQQPPSYRYQVMLQPTGKRWLFALAVPFSSSNNVGLTRNYRLLRSQPVDDVVSYNVASYTQLKRDPVLPKKLRQLDLRLPTNGNPKTRALVARWRQQTPNDKALVQRVLQWFHQQPFYYTLHPPTYPGSNSIDDFLFGQREGFCSHYASAFAFMMRQAGIPARVVAGYQGGQMSAVGNYLQVRQYDAHAWVEVWFKGQGWVREDPTAAVSPERIKDGLIPSLSADDEPTGASLSQWASGNLLSQLSMYGDYLNYLWQRWVLDYDQSRQRSLFKDWFVDINWTRLFANIAGVLLALAALVYGVRYWRRRRRWSPWQWQYRRLCRALSQRGVVVRPGDAPRLVIAKACQALPNKQDALMRWLNTYQQLAYASLSSEQQHQYIQQLKQTYPF